VLFVDLIDHASKPVLGTIFEVQLQPDARKPFTWPPRPGPATSVRSS